MSALGSVIGVGAASPVGFDARQTAFALRAKKLLPRPSEIRDKHGAAFGTARLLGLPDDVFGVDRMLAAAARALREASRDAALDPSKPLRVFLAMPERSRPLPKADAEASVPTVFLQRLERLSGVRIDGPGSEMLRLGHAGFAAALDRAASSLGSGPIAVGGVDTYYHPETLAWLDRELRVVSEEVHNGFVPSEGAAFLVFAKERSDKRPIARATHAMAGIEQLPEGAPRIAAVMTELVRGAVNGMRQKPVPWVLTDLNGERHRTKEWSFVTIRNNEVLVGGKTREEHFGQMLGDAGAATGAIAAAYAAVAFRTGFAPADEALIALHSDGDERGVVVLEAAQ
jgi:3-oxoacyl-[acyl-carrier-protein] synthase-1